MSSIPRFLAPRLAHLQSPIFVRRALPALSSTTTITTTAAPASARHASSSSSSSSSKPRVLEKPAKFVPPSHGQRLRKPAPQYGRDLSAEEKEVQKTKQYPNMMPPEGSVMHKFLTSRWLHVFISMSVLTSLAVFTISSDFKRTSPYADMLPSWGEFFMHPFAGLSQVLQVYKLHTQHKSEEAAERRRKKMDEVKKRKAYRVAHGMEAADEGLQLERTVLEAAGVKQAQEEVKVDESKQADDASPKAGWFGRK